MQKYQPANSFETPRFCGPRTFMRLPYKPTLQDVDFIVAGIPFDTGGSFRIGTRFGPGAIRNTSILLRPYNPNLEVNIFDYLSGVDYGDIAVIPGYIEDSYEKIQKAIEPVIAAGVVPVFMGGDHSITLPELRAIAKVKGKVALVHFDSHSDTWDAYFGKPYNHGTPFRRALEEGLLDPDHSIQVGLRGPLYNPDDWQTARNLGLEVVTARQVRELGLAETARRIKERVGTQQVFISFDIDFLDPAYAPGTGTPEIGGFTTWEAQYLLHHALTGLNYAGFDLVEVLPAHDHSEITAFAAAGMIYEFISLMALNKKANNEIPVK